MIENFKGHLHRQHSVLLSDMSSSDEDTATPRGVYLQPRQRRLDAQIGHRLPLHADTAGLAAKDMFSANLAVAAGGVTPTTYQDDAAVQQEMHRLFRARKNNALGTIPFGQTAPADYPSQAAVRYYDKNQLLVMARAETLQSSKRTVSPREIRLQKCRSDQGRVYALYQNGLEVRDPVQVKNLLVFLAGCLAVPSGHMPARTAPAPVVQAAPRLSMAERVFRRDAINTFAQRFTRSTSAIPTAEDAAALGKRPPLVRDISADGHALVIRRPDQANDTREGLVLHKQSDAQFALLRDGVALNNSKERSMALREIRRNLGMSEEHRPPVRQSGRRELARNMDNIVEDMTVSLSQQSVTSIDGHQSVMPTLALHYPHSIKLQDHVSRVGKDVIKWDKVISYMLVNGVPVPARALAQINSFAHDFLNRYGVAPLSRTVVATKEVDLGGGRKAATTTQFTGGQFVEGVEITAQDQIKASKKLRMLLYITGATDVLNPNDEKLIDHNVVRTPSGEQVAIDLLDGKSSPDKPGLFSRSTRRVLGQKREQVEAELNRAHAHAHRRIDKSMHSVPPEELAQTRALLDNYVDNCRERLRTM